MVYRLPTTPSIVPSPVDQTQIQQTPPVVPWRGGVIVRGTRPSDSAGSQEIQVAALEIDGDRVRSWPVQFIARVLHERRVLREVLAYVQQYAVPIFVGDRHIRDRNHSSANELMFRIPPRVLYENETVAVAPCGTPLAQNSSALLVGALFFDRSFPDLLGLNSPVVPLGPVIPAVPPMRTQTHYAQGLVPASLYQQHSQTVFSHQLNNFHDPPFRLFILPSLHEQQPLQVEDLFQPSVLPHFVLLPIADRIPSLSPDAIFVRQTTQSAGGSHCSPEVHFNCPVPRCRSVSMCRPDPRGHIRMHSDSKGRPAPTFCNYFLSTWGCPTLNLALEQDKVVADEGRLYSMIIYISQDIQLRRNFARSLSNPRKKIKAQLISDYITKILYERRLSDGPLKSGILRLLLKITESTQVYPSRFLLEGIKLSREPFGIGGCADVYKGKYNKLDVCVKVLRRADSTTQSQFLTASAREVILWAHMSHENILPFYGVYLLDEATRRMSIVSPLMKKGNLRTFLQNNSDTFRLPLILDIINGLCYLHQLDIIHGDLKAQNILISDDNRALITDFGLSHMVATTAAGSTDVTAACTIRWTAPELIQIESPMRPTKRSDIWSFGCLCYEVYTGKLPFYQFSRNQVLLALIQGVSPVRPDATDIECDQFSDWVWNLLQGCWKSNPNGRYTANEIRNILLAMMVTKSPPRTNLGLEDQKQAFWKAIQLQSDNHIDYEGIEQILVDFLEISKNQ